MRVIAINTIFSTLARRTRLSTVLALALWNAVAVAFEFTAEQAALDVIEIWVFFVPIGYDFTKQPIDQEGVRLLVHNRL